MGMSAMYGDFIMTFQPGVVAVSIVIAFTAAGAGLFIVVQIAYAGQSWLSIALRLVAALIIALAVNSMHYVGMLGAEYQHVNSASNFNHYLGTNLPMPAYIVIAVALGYCFAQLAAVYTHMMSLITPPRSTQSFAADETPSTTGA
mmetsp:Transcript_20977/g.56499  ORF Transcript_20977/g.56499 Transcript_20977/m.56499 type:complete len:145 (+) Transcript_20977:1-435(+)